MMRYLKLTLLLLVAAVAGGTFLLPQSKATQQEATLPAVWSVCPQGPPACSFSKIQEAIAAASPGDLIQIQSGTYSETLLISKNLRVVGAGQDLVRLQGAEAGKPVITLQVDGELKLLLNGLTIAGAPPASAEQPCFRGPPAPPENLICAHGLEVRGQGALALALVDLQIVESYGAGLICSGPEFEGSTVRLTVISSRIANNRGSGMVWSCDGEGDSIISLQDSIISGNGGHGFLAASFGGEVDIGGSTFSGNYTGISWRGSDAKLTISRSYFMHNVASGIEIEARMQSWANLSQLMVVGNGDGAVLVGDEGTRVTLQDSTLQENVGGRVDIARSVILRAGIVVITSGAIQIQRNMISKNQHGIVMVSVNPAQLDNNRIIENEGWGVAWLQPPCFEVPIDTRGVIQGIENEISDNGRGNLCPEDYNWPPNFRKP
jgi:nitrous oxidase accessory protein NosD